MTQLKLKKFDASMSGNRSGKPVINLNKSGLIRLNLGTANLLSLKEGDGVSIFQDEDEPSDWYIGKDKDGFKVRSDGSGGGLIFSCTALVTAINESIEREPGNVSFLIGDKTSVKGGFIYSIITRIPK